MESEAYDSGCKQCALGIAFANAMHIGVFNWWWRVRTSAHGICLYFHLVCLSTIKSILYSLRAYRSSFMISGCKYARVHFARAHKVNTLISMVCRFECNQWWDEKRRQRTKTTTKCKMKWLRWDSHMENDRECISANSNGICMLFI